MKSTLYILGSVTYALKAKNILFQNGIKVYIEKVKNHQGFGCGYAVRVNRDSERALSILKNSGFKIIAVIKENEDDLPG